MKRNSSGFLIMGMFIFTCFLSKVVFAKNQYVDIHLSNGENIKGFILASDSDSIKVKVAPEDYPIYFSSQVYLLSQSDTMSILKEEIKCVSAKSPNTDLCYSLFPGCFLHGWGHRYAGDYLAFNILGPAEILGAVFYFISPWAGLSFTQEQAKTSEERIATMRTIALTLFFGSWAYDIIFSPSAATEYNKSIQKEYNLPVSLEFNERNIHFAYRIVF